MSWKGCHYYEGYCLGLSQLVSIVAANLHLLLIVISLHMLSLGSLDIYFSSHSSCSKGSSKIMFRDAAGPEIRVVACVEDLTIAFLISYSTCF